MSSEKSVADAGSILTCTISFVSTFRVVSLVVPLVVSCRVVSSVVCAYLQGAVQPGGLQAARHDAQKVRIDGHLLRGNDRRVRNDQYVAS
jgi:hypothetical protein